MGFILVRFSYDIIFGSTISSNKAILGIFHKNHPENQNSFVCIDENVERKICYSHTEFTVDDVILRNQEFQVTGCIEIFWKDPAVTD